VLIGGRGHRVLPAQLRPLQIGHDEVVLAGELAVEQVLPAAVLVDDLLQAHVVDAVGVEQLGCDVQYVDSRFRRR
jgi:hypothetical protein